MRREYCMRFLVLSLSYLFGLRSYSFVCHQVVYLPSLLWLGAHSFKVLNVLTMDEDLFQFKAPQFAETWVKDDDDGMETFFNENKDPQTSSTPRNLSRRPYSSSVISRSGKRCRSSFRDSLFIRERESFNKRILNSIQENETQFKFKARPATIIKKEPFWPQRNSRFLVSSSAAPLKTEKRAVERKLFSEKKKKLEKLYESEVEHIKKIDEEELKRFRKTLEFKATPIMK